MKFKVFSLVIVCALLIVSCKSKQAATQGGASNQVSTAVTDRVPIDEEVSTTEVIVRTESVTPVDRSEAQTVYAFYVIIGSFREIANARRETSSLVSKGFSPVILANENGLFRISVGGYNAESAARAQIAEIRARYQEHRDVWLLVTK